LIVATRRRLLVAAGCLLLAGGVPAASAADHVSEPDDYWQGPTGGPVPAGLRGAKVIHAAALHALLQHGAVLPVDVANAPLKPDGMAPDEPWLPIEHQALPHALWIPGAGAGALTAEFDAFFRAQLAAATHGDHDRPLAVYCHERCWLSWNAAKRLLSYGYKRVYWFPEGIEGWRAARLPTVGVAATKPSP
jgi:PQQ-dependent catabolism-associated CXXCW motif protein